MTVAIVTPWHNHLELEDDYTTAIYAGGPDDVSWDLADVPGWPDEVFIIDSGSDPPLTGLELYRRFEVIRTEDNVGFSAACNHGLRAATSDVVVFLNNDIALGHAGWLQRIVEQVEPGVLVGQLRNDPHGWVDGQPMPYLDGWCLAGTRKDLLKLGGFDETLEEPAYYSDNLLCLEARAAGMTLREVRVGLHHKGSTTSQPSLNPEVHAVTQRNGQRYLARARQLLIPVS